jgi:hypothetical protein
LGTVTKRTTPSTAIDYTNVNSLPGRDIGDAQPTTMMSRPLLRFIALLAFYLDHPSTGIEPGVSVARVIEREFMPDDERRDGLPV